MLASYPLAVVASEISASAFSDAASR